MRGLHGRLAIFGLLLVFGVSTTPPVWAARDFNKDGQDDLAMYDPITRTWYLQQMNGSAIGTPIVWGDEGALPLAGDFDGDGFADLAVYHPATGTWDIRAVDGSLLAEDLAWGAANAIPFTGDFNNDGACDLGYYIPATGAWHIRTLGGTALASGVSLGISGAVPVPGDYNNDGIFDLAVFKAGKWYIRTLLGADIVWAQDWGWNGAEPVAGDFNGDGIFDMAVYDPATAKWYIRNVNGSVLGWELKLGSTYAVPLAGRYNGGDTYQMVSFGPKPSSAWAMRSISGAFSVSGLQVAGAPKTAVPVGPLYSAGDINYSTYKANNDFDGDGASDLAVYHPATGNWFIRKLNGQTLAWYRSWGYPGTLPVPADYTGNGVADLAVYDPSNGKWFIVAMNHTPVTVGFAWGFPGAVPVPGDYDGDGVADLGVYDLNNGKWYVWSLAKQKPLLWEQSWGWKGDVRRWERPPTSTVIPVPYDYDNDGKTDMAVYYRGVSMETSLWYILGTTGTSWIPTAHWGSSTSLGTPGRYAHFNDARWPMGVSVFKIAASGYLPEWNTPYVQGNQVNHGIFMGTYGRTFPVPALDFDGNGWDDYAVYDYVSGEWSVILSTGDGTEMKDQPVQKIGWGFSGAIPANIYNSIYRASGYSIKPW